jgi:hypothetical protein
MGRQELEERERANFWLYIDEFQNFVTPSMAAILSGARKYHLGLILSHHDMEQLSKRDSEVASSAISNPALRICFRLGDFDARKLQDGFSYFGAQDLQNLGVGEAICRIERAEYDFNLKTLPLAHVDSNVAMQRRGSIMVISRNKYARRREDVEAEFFKDEPEAEPPPHSETEQRHSEQTKQTEKTTRSKPSTEENDTQEHPQFDERSDQNLDGENERSTDSGRKAPSGEPEPPPINLKVSVAGFGSATTTAEKPKFRSRTPPSAPGRGGQQHKRLQSAIQHLAPQQRLPGDD